MRSSYFTVHTFLSFLTAHDSSQGGSAIIESVTIGTSVSGFVSHSQARITSPFIYNTVITSPAQLYSIQITPTTSTGQVQLLLTNLPGQSNTISDCFLHSEKWKDSCGQKLWGAYPRALIPPDSLGFRVCETPWRQSRLLPGTYLHDLFYIAAWKQTKQSTNVIQVNRLL